MRLQPWPKTLSSQMVLIIFSGVTIALLLSTAIHLRDRGEALTAMGQLQTAQRLSAVVHLFDTLTEPERRRISPVLRTPLQYVRVLDQLPPADDPVFMDQDRLLLSHLLQQHLPPDRVVRVVSLTPREWDRNPMSKLESGGWDDSDVANSRMGTLMRHHRPHLEVMQQIMPDGISFVIQVQLMDRSWVEFHNHLPKDVFTWPRHLLISLFILLITVLILSTLAVRLATRPLAILASAAQSLGEDLKRPPLSETGPHEVRRATRAFNVMQARIIRFVQERTHLLAAISHDLKTPLTRMRLRVEMLKDPTLQEKLLANLHEMDGMVLAAMDYIKGMEGMEAVTRVDLGALFARIQDEFQEMGFEVELRCADLPPVLLMENSWKRCMTNLISNAVAYGQRALVQVEIQDQHLRITISDQGEGIPESEMARVLEPFVRLEASRSKRTGGTGLGLPIALNIVRAHQGKMTLGNQLSGGLEVVITVPVE